MSLFPVATALNVAVVLAVVIQVGFLVRAGVGAGLIRFGR
jgi:type III secretory pathway component EscU